MNKVNSIRSTILHFSLFVVVLVFVMLEPKSMLTVAKIHTSILIIHLVLLILFLIAIFFKHISHKNTFRFEEKSLFSLVICVFCVLTSLIINRDYSMGNFNVILILLISFFAIHLIEPATFFDTYVKVIVFLAFYSLICNYLLKYIPIFKEGFLTSFDHQNGGKGIDYIFCYVYSQTYGDNIRNYSIFNEPGTFQLYLTFALTLILYNKRTGLSKRITTFSFIVIVITYITTLSPLSYVVLLLLIIPKLTNINKIKAIALISVAALIFLFLFNGPYSSQIINSFSKFNGGESLNARIGSIFGNINGFLNKPFFGWGYTGTYLLVRDSYLAEYDTIHNTNTILLQFVMFGFMYGIVMCAGVFGFIKKISSNVFSFIFVLIALFLSLSNESFVDSPLYYVFVFYGILLSHQKSYVYSKHPKGVKSCLISAF